MNVDTTMRNQRAYCARLSISNAPKWKYHSVTLEGGEGDKLKVGIHSSMPEALDNLRTFGQALIEAADDAERLFKSAPLLERAEWTVGRL